MERVFVWTVLAIVVALSSCGRRGVSPRLEESFSLGDVRTSGARRLIGGLLSRSERLVPESAPHPESKCIEIASLRNIRSRAPIPRLCPGVAVPLGTQARSRCESGAESAARALLTQRTTAHRTRARRATAPADTDSERPALARCNESDRRAEPGGTAQAARHDGTRSPLAPRDQRQRHPQGRRWARVLMELTGDCRGYSGGSCSSCGDRSPLSHRGEQRGAACPANPRCPWVARAICGAGQGPARAEMDHVGTGGSPAVKSALSSPASRLVLPAVERAAGNRKMTSTLFGRLDAAFLVIVSSSSSPRHRPRVMVPVSSALRLCWPQRSTTRDTETPPSSATHSDVRGNSDFLAGRLGQQLRRRLRRRLKLMLVVVVQGQLALRGRHRPFG
ncbi:unnamed protein product [Lampetra fluviatilis]